MKKNTFVLIILSLLLFTNMSCEDDDNNNTNEEIKLTATNYIYEGDLRTFYLESEINRLNEDIEEWMQIPDSDPGYNQAQENIAAANDQIDLHETEIAGILSPAEAFSIINPIIPPIPPSPSPCICFNVYNSIRNIVLLPGTDQLSLTIRDYNTESIIVSTNNNSPIETIPNTQNSGRFQPFLFEQPGINGQAILTIQSDGQTYSILLDFQELE